MKCSICEKKIIKGKLCNQCIIDLAKSQIKNKELKTAKSKKKQPSFAPQSILKGNHTTPNIKALKTKVD